MNIIILGSLGYYNNMVGQRQHFLAKELAKNHKIIFIETHDSGVKKDNDILIDSFMTGNWLQNSYDLKTMENKLEKILNKHIKKTENNIVIFEIPLPCYINLIPTFKKYNCKIHYDCIDNWKYFYGGNVIDTDRTKELIDNCKSFSATADYLINDLKQRYNINHISLIPNAYGYLENEEAIVKIDKEKINICYFGSLGEWFDWKLLKSIIHKPDNKVCFHIFGNYAERKEFPKLEFDKLINNTNFKYYGYIKRSQIKQMLTYMDYAIIPFVDTPLIYATDAVKAYEIAANYKKILHPEYMVEMFKFPDEIRISYNRDFNFNNLSKTYYINENEIKDFISKNTWEIRSKKLLEAINGN